MQVYKPQTEIIENLKSFRILGAKIGVLIHRGIFFLSLSIRSNPQPLTSIEALS